MFLVINCNRDGCLEPQSISTTLSVRLYSLFFFCLVLSRLKQLANSLVLPRHKHGSKTGSHPYRTPCPLSARTTSEFSELTAMISGLVQQSAEHQAPLTEQHALITG